MPTASRSPRPTSRKSASGARYRAAIVGCGDIAGGYDERSTDSSGVFTHAGAYRRLADHALLAACAEPDSARRAAFQRAWSVPEAFDGLDALLAAGPFGS